MEYLYISRNFASFFFFSFPFSVASSSLYQYYYYYYCHYFVRYDSSISFKTHSSQQLLELIRQEGTQHDIYHIWPQYTLYLCMRGQPQLSSVSRTIIREQRIFSHPYLALCAVADSKNSSAQIKMWYVAVSKWQQSSSELPGWHPSALGPARSFPIIRWSLCQGYHSMVIKGGRECQIIMSDHILGKHHAIGWMIIVSRNLGKERAVCRTRGYGTEISALEGTSQLYMNTQTSSQILVVDGNSDFCLTYVCSL